MKILSLDPGFANLGYSVIELVPAGLRIVDAGVFTTHASDKKRKILSVDDNLRRAREIASFLGKTIHVHNICAIAAESMSFPRNSSAAAKVAMTWGVIIALAEAKSLPVVQVSPQEVKLKTCGSKSASKSEVQKKIQSTFDIERILLDRSIARSLFEHAYDSVAVAKAVENSELILMLRQFRAGSTSG